MGCGSCFFILAVFKYSSFLLENIAAILQIYLGIELKYSISWVVPVGISFYIFQATAYLLDVYYGRIRAERNLIDYALYVSFFPTVLSGPIERGTTLLPQIKLQRMFDLDLFRKGGILVLWGAFLKLVLAERLAIYVNYVWDGIDECSGIFMIIAAIAYSLQIYCDFKSYSDIATGIALMLGFQLSLNFCQPYFAESISDFWRRWHISLSSWFRDYLYIPLGGGRCKRVKKYRNIMVVFLISGIWHGANWTFILWGLLFAVLLIIEKFFLLKQLEKTPKILNHIYVLFIVMISFIIFNSNNIGQAKHQILGLFGANGEPIINTYTLYYLKSYAVIFVIAIIGATPLIKNIINGLNRNIKIKKIINLLEPIFIVLIFLIVTAYLVDNSYNPFLYFRF